MTHLVIPVAAEPQNSTLTTTLETVARFAPWLNVVLVGETTQLEPYGVDTLSFWEYPGHSVENTTLKLIQAATAPDSDISDPFVWSNDDIFFRAPVTLEDLVTTGAIAKPSKLEDEPPKTQYGRAAQDAATGLRLARRPTWNYERHVPLVVYKADMLRAVEISRGAPRSAYQNLRLEAPVFRRPDVKLFVRDKVPMPVPPLQLRPPFEPFVSTGNRYPVELIRESLGLV